MKVFNAPERDRKDRFLAMLWDESFLWGIVAYHALKNASVPFRLVTARDISEGGMDGAAALFVPGGWASNKIKALGESGVARIKQFVQEGGTYIGFCGGAGLATSEELRLVDAKRRRTSHRVPSFSGRIRLALKDDPLWRGIRDPIFSAWWPSQLEVGQNVEVLARYEDACADAFTSDLNVGDVLAVGGWKELEELYGINLDPRRMRNDPAVIRAQYGRGTVFLSLVHFDSPDDSNGKTVLENLWTSLTAPNEDLTLRRPLSARPARPFPPLPAISPALTQVIGGLKERIDGLIDLGIRNFLWFKQGPFFIQWRRGVRGLEYYTLKVMVDELFRLMTRTEEAGTLGLAPTTAEDIEAMSSSVAAQLAHIRELLFPFLEEASRLLLLERRAMLSERITFELSADPKIRAIREHLFSTSKSYGGSFKQVLSQIDSLLYSLLTYGNRDTPE